MSYWIVCVALSAFEVICVYANDIPAQFVVAGSDVYQGNDFQTRQADFREIQGVWHFGDSESEWSAAIIPHDEGIIVQTSSVFYSDESQNFLSIYATVNNPKFTDGALKIAKPHGKKGHYNAILIESKSVDPNARKKTKMLLLDGNSLDSRKGALQEGGFFSDTLKKWFGDQYALSCTILGEDQLKGKNDAELTLLRNSIFARYGLIFSDPVLKNHFSKQDGYRPWKTDVTDCITDLEWINIRNIQKQEKTIIRE